VFAEPGRGGARDARAVIDPDAEADLRHRATVGILQGEEQPAALQFRVGTRAAAKISSQAWRVRDRMICWMRATISARCRRRSALLAKCGCCAKSGSPTAVQNRDQIPLDPRPRLRGLSAVSKDW
jgi:hypothetical protein